MTTISVRVSDTILADLQDRASQERQTVSGVIRLLIRDYLDEALGTDALGAMEARIVATIERAERQRARQKRQTELTLLEVDYLRREMDYRYMKRLGPNEDPVSIFRRSDKSYFGWLQKVHKKRLDILMNAISEPAVMLEEAEDPSAEAPSAEAGPVSAFPKAPVPPDHPANVAARPAVIVKEAKCVTEEPLPAEAGISVRAPKPMGVSTTDVDAPTAR
jgi:Ribbon-helix-helix protein, copG family.